MATQSTFDFTSYNKTMSVANSGLKMYLALQMLQEVESTMRRFNSPLAKDMVDIVDELSSLRDANKKYLANRDNTTPATIDNPENKATSTTDIQVELDRVAEGKADGKI